MPLKSLELSRRASEMETENAEMRLAINGMEPDAADRETKMTEYTTKLQEQLDVMKQRDASLDEEDKAAQLAMATNADTSGMTPQLREFHNLGQRTSIVNYMQATVSEKRVSGAEAEYNDEVFGGNWQQGDYPTEMLLERSEYGGLAANAIADMQGEEKRTLITGVVAGSENESYVVRLLAGGDGAYLGASYPSVGPGRHSFPIVSGSTVAATIARGTAEVAAGGISIVNADPARVQHSYEINSADELQMAGLMPYMQSDLRASLTSGLDVKVLTDLLSGLTEVNDNTTMTLAKLLAKFGGAVDGKGAKNVNQVRILASNESYTFVSALNIANVGTFMSLVPHDRFLASSNMPDHGTANHGHGIAYRTGAGALQRLIVPVWRRGQLLRDTGRLQLAGTITITGVMYADVIVVNSDLHQQLEFTNA